jgi:hypothetical protein
MRFRLKKNKSKKENPKKTRAKSMLDIKVGEE